MTELRKESFNTIMQRDNTIEPIEVEGYVFTVTIRGRIYGLGVYKKNSRKWMLSDLYTGRALADPNGFRTRRDAVMFAESEAFTEKMHELVADDPEAYVARADVFRDLIEAEGTMRASIYHIEVAERAARMREEAPERAMDELAEANVAAEEVAAITTVDTMKEVISGWDEVIVRQAKGEGACIWVIGELDAHKDELAEMGFHPGRSKKFGRGWWLKPQTA